MIPKARLIFQTKNNLYIWQRHLSLILYRQKCLLCCSFLPSAAILLAASRHSDLPMLWFQRERPCPFSRTCRLVRDGGLFANVADNPYFLNSRTNGKHSIRALPSGLSIARLACCSGVVQLYWTSSRSSQSRLRSKSPNFLLLSLKLTEWYCTRCSRAPTGKGCSGGAIIDFNPPRILHSSFFLFLQHRSLPRSGMGKVS